MDARRFRLWSTRSTKACSWSTRTGGWCGQTSRPPGFWRSRPAGCWAARSRVRLGPFRRRPGHHGVRWAPRSTVPVQVRDARGRRDGCGVDPATAGTGDDGADRGAGVLRRPHRAAPHRQPLPGVGRQPARRRRGGRRGRSTVHGRDRGRPGRGGLAGRGPAGPHAGGGPRGGPGQEDHRGVPGRAGRRAPGAATRRRHQRPGADLAHRVRPGAGPAGTVVAAMAVSRDVTDQVRAAAPVPAAVRRGPDRDRAERPGRTMAAGQPGAVRAGRLQRRGPARPRLPVDHPSRRPGRQRRADAAHARR